jgi:hypothetical protein
VKYRNRFQNGHAVAEGARRLAVERDEEELLVEQRMHDEHGDRDGEQHERVGARDAEDVPREEDVVRLAARRLGDEQDAGAAADGVADADGRVGGTPARWPPPRPKNIAPASAKASAKAVV